MLVHTPVGSTKLHCVWASKHFTADPEKRERKNQPSPLTSSKRVLSRLPKAQNKNAAGEQSLLTDRSAPASIFTERQPPRQKQLSSWHPDSTLNCRTPERVITSLCLTANGSSSLPTPACLKSSKRLRSFLMPIKLQYNHISKNDLFKQHGFFFLLFAIFQRLGTVRICPNQRLCKRSHQGRLMRRPELG